MYLKPGYGIPGAFVPEILGFLDVTIGERNL